MAVRRAQWACPWAGLLGWAGAALLALAGAGRETLGAPESGVPLFPDAVIGGDIVGFTSVSGDFNGDGRPDLVEDIRVCTAFDSCYRALAVHLGRGPPGRWRWRRPTSAATALSTSRWRSAAGRPAHPGLRLPRSREA